MRVKVAFREAAREDLAAIIALLTDDPLGATRESRVLERYVAAFEAILAEAGNAVIIGEAEGRIVATYQLSFISGLSHHATRRAQVESVRVAADLRGRGIGHAMMADAEARSRAAGCALLQLTSHASRNRARNFYDALGYVASHVGYKRRL